MKKLRLIAKREKHTLLQETVADANLMMESDSALVTEGDFRKLTSRLT